MPSELTTAFRPVFLAANAHSCALSDAGFNPNPTLKHQTKPNLEQSRTWTPLPPGGPLIARRGPVLEVSERFHRNSPGKRETKRKQQRIVQNEPELNVIQ